MEWNFLRYVYQDNNNENYYNDKQTAFYYDT